MTPHLVAWNLTERCNLACPHCYADAGRGGRGGLDTAACLDIAEQLAVGAPMIVLTGGEPLLREDLEVIAERAVRRGAMVVVGTNGTALGRDRLAALREAGVSGYALSVDSLDPAVHDAFRGLPGALDRTFAAIDALRAVGASFVVQTSLCAANRQELEALAEWAASVGAVAFNVFVQVETGRARSSPPLPAAEVAGVARRVVALERRFRGRLMVRTKCQPDVVRHVGEPDSPLLGRPCPAGVSYVRVDARGRVTPCPYLPVVAGDLNTTSFAEIWRESPVLRALREEALGGRCGACELKPSCGGCRARAWARTGDLLAADEACDHRPGLAPPPPAPDAPLRWTPEAEALMTRIPAFARGMVARRVEAFARRAGRADVDAALLAELRARMGGHGPARRLEER